MFMGTSEPLKVDEVMICLKKRWKFTYDLQLIVRNKRLYLQMMWGYLEQQSFPLDENAYRNHLNEVLEVINRLGLSEEVRVWLNNSNERPRLGRAVSLQLNGGLGLQEFVL
tara:strand:- start:220 stop:552 length:333 start_codon:yes stop_codon:yes gene_type:complete